MDEVPEFSDKEKLDYEAELLGIYVSGHPLDKYADVINQMSSMPISEIQDIRGQDKREMSLVGMIRGCKNIFTKKGDKMSFVTFEDLSGKIEAIVFPKVFEKYESLLSHNGPLLLKGNVNLSEDPRKIFPEKISLLEDETDSQVSGVRINLTAENLSSLKLSKLKQVLLGHRGSVPLHVIIEAEEGRARMPLGNEYLVNATPQMAATINELLQANSVQFIINGQLSVVD